MNDNQALPGGAVFESFKKLVEHPKVKENTTQQDKIATLVNSDGFKALGEVIDYYIETLREIPINPETDTPESVGFRYLASKITIGYLEDIKKLPQRQADLIKMSQESNE